jgi:hypothetical protein
MVTAAGFPARAEEPPATPAAPMTLTVIGVKNEIKDPQWENQLIGTGISKLVLQALYETGKFKPIEDNPEILAQVDRMVKLQWSGDTPIYKDEDAEKIAKDLKTDAVAWARTISFSVRRFRGGFAALMSGAKTTVTVDIEVFVKEKGRPLVSARSRGTASTNSSGIFFQVRQDKVYFDQTTVGKATQSAVYKAVKELKLP